MSLVSIVVNAQFVDIDWASSDSVVPYYTNSYDIGRDYVNNDYTLEVNFPETEPATETDLAKYSIEIDSLDEEFAVTTFLGVYRKNGKLDVCVYPFARQGKQVVKLISFKPELKITPKASISTSLLTSSLLQTRSGGAVLYADGDSDDSSTSRYTEQSVLTSGTWVKIRVSSAGVYELTSSRLASMGFSNPDRVKLYGYNLPVLPESNIEEITDDLSEIPLWRKSNGSLLFYSCGTVSWTRSRTSSISVSHSNNPYSNYVYYFLTESDEEPMSFSSVDNGDSSSVSSNNLITTTEYYSLVEDDEYSFINSGRQFFESYDYADGNSRTYTLDLTGISSSSVNLSVRFASSAESASTLRVSDSESTICTISLSSKLTSYYYASIGSATFTWDNSSGGNNITLTHTRASGVSGHLDYIQAVYSRNLNLNSSSLLFRPSYTSASAIRTYRINGATSGTVVWNVTPGETPYEVVGYLNNGYYYVSIEDDASNWNEMQYVAVNTENTFSAPEYVETIDNQNLHSLSNIDMLIIVPANGTLTTQAQRLADAHESRDGMVCAVVRADQIYNEFSSGTPDATAYRRLMKMLYDKAETDDAAPKNLLLFGEGYWDNRFVTSGLTSLSQDDYLLCYESDLSISHTDSYVLEEYYTLLDDGEGSKVLQEKPDAGVGRIPVSTSTEAKQVVDKLITYINNEYAGAWKNVICMMADDGNSQIHMRDAEAVIAQTEELNPDYHNRRIYWDTYTIEATSTGNSYPGAEDDINKQMQDGALIMNYTGHGAAYCLSHEMVMKTSDFENWNSPRLPLWITAACDVSPFDMNEDNIGVTALLNPDGAAMGMITTTRTVYSTQNRTLNLNFMKYVLGSDDSGRRYTIGEALALAKSDIVSNISNSNISNVQSTAFRNAVNKAHFVLLGDPAISLTTQKYKVKIDSFGGIDFSSDDAESDTATIYTGRVATVTGHIVDEDGNSVENYNGVICPVVYDALETVELKNNQEESLSSTAMSSYDEHITALYSGTDSIRNGQFEFSFPVPLDILYSDGNGLLSLYAVNDETTLEANGKFENFIYAASDEVSSDTIGPEIQVYLNSESFVSGDNVNESPVLIAYISDESGISTSGTGVGHDIVAIIDNEESMTYTLNSYFTRNTGDYTSGSLMYALSGLEEGKHTLMLRAWDTMNNSSTVEIEFNVVEGLSPNIFELTCTSPARSEAVFTITCDRPYNKLDLQLDVYDIAGRKVWDLTDQVSSETNTYSYTWDISSSSTRLYSGIYICKAYISTDGGASASKAKKFVVLGLTE